MNRIAKILRDRGLFPEDVAVDEIVKEFEEEIVGLMKIHRDSTEPMGEYHRGMYNGMECLRACLIGKEPEYVDPELKAQGLE